MKSKSKKPVVIGIIAGLILLSIYFGILTAANSFSHAIEQFTEMWYWILILVIGFGFQVGLYSYIRSAMHAKHMAGATAEVATAGGISTGSMIACCAHHVTDVLPIIGLAAAAVFLVKYQLLFILIGVFSNLVGVTMMLGIIQKHELFDHEKSLFKNIFKYNMKTIRNITIVLSIIILSIIFISTKSISETNDANLQGKVIDLSKKINNENKVTIEVTPIDFGFDDKVKFDIAIDTHQGSLDFDMAKISVLEDEKGNKYFPLNWEGSPPGGHHRSGILTFPKLKGKTNYIKLIIRNVYEIPERVFIWEIN